MAAPTVPRTPNVHRAHESLNKSADGSVHDSISSARLGKEQVRKGEYLIFSFARKALLWLAAAAVKAQDELAALGLDCRRGQPKIRPLSGQRKKSNMNLPNHK
jgi:hypothetical protein